MKKSKTLYWLIPILVVIVVFVIAFFILKDNGVSDVGYSIINQMGAISTSGSPAGGSP